MPKISGRKIAVGFGKETTRGTAVAPSLWYPRVDMDFDEKIESVENESSIGVLTDTVDSEIVRQYAEGTIGGNFAVNALALPLYALFGSVTTTTDTTGAYKHAFSLLDTNQRQSLTVAMYDNIANYKFAMGTIKKMKLKYEQDKFIEVSMEFIGKKGVVDGALSPAFTTEYYLMGRHTKVRFATALAGLGAASDILVKSFELDIEVKTEEDYSLGDITPTDFLGVSVSISGNIEAMYQNEAEYKTIALAGSSQAMRINAIDTSKTIGVSSNPSFKIDLPKVKFTEWARKMGNNEIVTQTCKLKAHYSVADAKSIVAELINTLSAI